MIFIKKPEFRSPELWVKVSMTITMSVLVLPSI